MAVKFIGGKASGKAEVFGGVTIDVGAGTVEVTDASYLGDLEEGGEPKVFQFSTTTAELIRDAPTDAKQLAIIEISTKLKLLRREIVHVLAGESSDAEVIRELGIVELLMEAGARYMTIIDTVRKLAKGELERRDKWWDVLSPSVRRGIEWLVVGGVGVILGFLGGKL